MAGRATGLLPVHVCWFTNTINCHPARFVPFLPRTLQRNVAISPQGEQLLYAKGRQRITIDVAELKFWRLESGNLIARKPLNAWWNWISAQPEYPASYPH
jgi:hypothetical protein